MSLQPNVCEASVGGVVGWLGDFGMGAKEPPLLEGQIHPGKGFADDSVAVEVFQVSGSVRWFDPSKGYGFLVPDQDLPDVLLQVTCLRRDGFQTAHEGTRIVCDAVRTAKRLQAFRIHAMDTSPSVHPSQLPQRTKVVVIPESNWERALVKWFNRARGSAPHPWSADGRHLCVGGNA